MTLHSFSIIFVMAATSITGGCSVKDYPLVNPPKLVTPPGTSLENRVRFGHWMVDTSVSRLEWSIDGQTYDASDVIRRSVGYLQDKGVWRNRWQQESAQEQAKPGFSRTTRAKYLVGLHPIIVIGPATKEVSHASFSGLDLEPRGGPENPKLYLKLPYYFFADTQVPWSEGLMWFSPDLEKGPIPLERMRTGPDEYRIPVPWGALVLRREGESLEVSAVGNDQNRKE